MKKINVQKLIASIEADAARNIAEANIGAASVAVMQDDQLLYKNFFGDMTQQNGEKIGENTVFRLASMSKPITAVAIGILWSRNFLSLDDPIEKYIPCFKDLHIRNLDENDNVVDLGAVKTKPTIFHLLTHTSGLGSDIVAERLWSTFSQEDIATLETSMPVYAAAGAAFDPLSRECYSAVIGFDILARIVEIISGQSSFDFLQENLFGPCEMYDTGFAPTEEQWERMITVHNKVDNKCVVGETEPGKVFGNIPVTHTSGGAGMIGTLPDYMHFAEMLLHKGEYHGKRIVSEEYITQMAKAQVPEVMPYNQCWGYGVRCVVDETYADLPVGAFGWSGAFGTHFWVDPANKVTAFYMKNSLFDGGAGAKTAVELEKAVTAAMSDE
ncbi:MAG: beta-lactamase family protein [Clostridia bacterium]|nr:beta-lactamase family protein [Clostridia bacterium]